MKKIIIDTYGADAGPVPVIRGALHALSERADLSLVLVGDQMEIEQQIKEMNADSDRIEIMDTDKYITNHDAPTRVFKGAEDTSMVMALTRLKADDETIGLISAGNTGALLVGSICHVGLMKGLMVPALATAIPCKDEGLLCLVDCGANVDCTPEDLKRFAIMGNAFMQSYMDVENPKIGLVSVGKEQGKGNTLCKAAYELIAALPLNFIGNLEGCDVINSEADVVVTDGFIGNVLLKNIEACGKYALALAEKQCKNQQDFARIKQSLLEKFDFNSRGGATFLGVKKTVVKMHGCAVEETVSACVGQLLRLEEHKFSERIEIALQK